MPQGYPMMKEMMVLRAMGARIIVTLSMRLFLMISILPVFIFPSSRPEVHRIFLFFPLSYHM